MKLSLKDVEKLQEMLKKNIHFAIKIYKKRVHLKWKKKGVRGIASTPGVAIPYTTTAIYVKPRG